MPAPGSMLSTLKNPSTQKSCLLSTQRISNTHSIQYNNNYKSSTASGNLKSTHTTPSPSTTSSPSSIQTTSSNTNTNSMLNGNRSGNSKEGTLQNLCPTHKLKLKKLISQLAHLDHLTTQQTSALTQKEEEMITLEGRVEELTSEVESVEVKWRGGLSVIGEYQRRMILMNDEITTLKKLNSDRVSGGSVNAAVRSEVERLTALLDESKTKSNQELSQMKQSHQQRTKTLQKENKDAQSVYNHDVSNLEKMLANERAKGFELQGRFDALLKEGGGRDFDDSVLSLRSPEALGGTLKSPPLSTTVIAKKTNTISVLPKLNKSSEIAIEVPRNHNDNHDTRIEEADSSFKSHVINISNTSLSLQGGEADEEEEEDILNSSLGDESRWLQFVRERSHTSNTSMSSSINKSVEGKEGEYGDCEEEEERNGANNVKQSLDSTAWSNSNPRLPSAIPRPISQTIAQSAGSGNGSVSANKFDFDINSILQNIQRKRKDLGTLTMSRLIDIHGEAGLDSSLPLVNLNTHNKNIENDRLSPAKLKVKQAKSPIKVKVQSPNRKLSSTTPTPTPAKSSSPNHKVSPTKIKAAVSPLIKLSSTPTTSTSISHEKAKLKKKSPLKKYLKSTSKKFSSGNNVRFSGDFDDGCVSDDDSYAGVVINVHDDDDESKQSEILKNEIYASNDESFYDDSLFELVEHLNELDDFGGKGKDASSR